MEAREASSAASPEVRRSLRELPSVEELLQTEPLRSAASNAPRALVVASARAELERRRRELRRGNGGAPSRAELARAAAAELARRQAPSLRTVINATGVVVHTNLGRSPLAAGALEAVERVARGYSTLEYDLDRGERGSRQAHVEELIVELTGAEAALVVNNNAGAVLLALAALAFDREVVISRGQLVEIGGSFRVPEILRASGARLVEVGTTNRTRLDDYRTAITADTAALMRVHTSNFRVVGFTEEVGIAELAGLARSQGLALIDDLGSGALTEAVRAAGSDSERVHELIELLRDEPSAGESVRAGADVVCFSGDKLIGGPQAGLVAGRREPIERLRRHPLARALRIDKLSLAALDATLRLYREPERACRELPTLAMLTASEEELVARAHRLRDELSDLEPRAGVTVEWSAGRVGGGALPLMELEGPVVAITPQEGGVDALHARLRAQEPPIVARVSEGALFLDPRTVREDELSPLSNGVRAALA